MPDALAKRILIAGGDVVQRNIVKRGLEAEGFEARAVEGRDEAVEALETRRPDVVLLDVSLPGVDTLAFCRELQIERDLPVVMAIPGVASLRRDAGHDLWVEDFVVKPAEISEVVLRVQAAFRRHLQNRAAREAGGPSVPTSSRFRFEAGIVDITRRMAWRHDGSRIDLTEIEFRLLRHLITNAGRDLTRDELWSAASGRPWQPYDRNLDVHIAHLRRKIEPGSGGRELIRSVRGVGYVFSGSVERLPSPTKPTVWTKGVKIREKLSWAVAANRKRKRMASQRDAVRRSFPPGHGLSDESDPIG